MENQNRKMLEKLNKTAPFLPESIHYYYYSYYYSLFFQTELPNFRAMEQKSFMNTQHIQNRIEREKQEEQNQISLLLIFFFFFFFKSISTHPAVTWPVCTLDEVHLFFTNGYNIG